MGGPIATTQLSMAKKSDPSPQSHSVIADDNITNTDSIKNSVNVVTSGSAATDMSVVKNKRKNFNPRCSSVTRVDRQCHKFIQKTPVPAKAQTVMMESSLKLRGIKKTHDNEKVEQKLTSSDVHFNSLTPTTPTVPLPSSIVNQDDLDVQQQQRCSLFHKLQSLFQNQARTDNADNGDNHQKSPQRFDLNLDETHINARNYTRATMIFGHTDAEQNRINAQTQLESDDCNTHAFNAVQDLLNVYGIQISTSEIVAALQKNRQKVDVCKQPPTPPQTPGPISFPALLSNTIALQEDCKNGNLKSKKTKTTACDSKSNARNNNIGESILNEILESNPLIKVANISKLMRSFKKCSDNEKNIESSADLKFTNLLSNESMLFENSLQHYRGPIQNQNQTLSQNRNRNQNQYQNRNRNQNHILNNQNKDENHHQYLDQTEDQDHDQDQYQGQSHNQEQNQQQNQNHHTDPNPDRDPDPDPDQNQDQDADRDQDQDKDQDEDEEQDDDQDDNQDDDDQDPDLDPDPDEDEDADTDQDQDHDQDPDQVQHHIRGQHQNRQDQAHDQRREQDECKNYQNDLNINVEDLDQYQDEDSTTTFNFDRNLNEDSNVSTVNDRPMSDDQTSGDEMLSGSGSYIGAQDGCAGAQWMASSSANLFDKCSLGLFSPLLQLPQIRCEERPLTAENTKNLSKFSSYVQCKNEQCKIENLREHYHCFDSPCFSKILIKKEEIIRHLKWHKKRNESISHGFLRFSSSDDCSVTFGTVCTHNRKQTHYHCFQPNCGKVYISTSDVQMHSNYHRKDSAIFQEGFQRFRATEECNAYYCLFSGQRTTHFHCRRDNCRFTFKNKSDMEKHKSFHVKDKQLAQDGFKKFLKNEPCPYSQCRFSRVCNHIHCVRENCYYVLHSSGQLLSHKRKHDRVDGEQAYCRYKMQQKKALLDEKIRTDEHLAVSHKSFQNRELCSPPLSLSGQISPMPLVKGSSVQLTNTVSNSAIGHIDLDPTNNAETSLSPNCVLPNADANQSQSSLGFLKQMQLRHKEIMRREQHTEVTSKINANNFGNNIYGNDNVNESFNGIVTTDMTEHFPNSEKSLQEFFSMIQQFFTDKCTKQTISLIRNSSTNAINSTQSEPLNLNLGTDLTESNITNDSGNDYVECFLNTNDHHLHCLVKDCEAIILHNLNDITAHIRMHEFNRTSPADSILNNPNLMQITSIEGFFNRKRGRPPKNRVVEVYNNVQHSPQAIFTSFKLEKTSTTPDNLLNSPSTSSQVHQTIGACSQYLIQETNSKPVYTAAPQTVSHPLQKPLEVKNSSITETNVRTNGRHFIMYEPNEKCYNYQQCPLYKNLHFHCTYSMGGIKSTCNFVTKYGRAMDAHTQQAHMEQSIPVASPNNLITIDGDCGVNACGFRKIKTHYHCRKCFQGFVSPLEFQVHICTMAIAKLTTVNSNLTTNNTKLKANQTSIESPSIDQQTTDDEDTQLVSNIKKHCGHAGNNNGDADSSATKSEHSEDERGVSVVRAAGTFFPQNTRNIASAEMPSNNVNESIQTLSMRNAQNNSICRRPFCKLKRKVHGHCEFCNQGFSDLVKLKTHQLKHASTKLNNLMALNSPTSVHQDSFSNDEKVLNDGIKYDDSSDHPQDLSCRLSQFQPESQTKNQKTSDRLISNSSLPTAQSSTANNAVDVNNAGLLLNLQQCVTAPSLLSPIMTANHLPSLHLAHLANYYQLNPYNYHNFYSLLSGVAAAGLGCTGDPKTFNLPSPADLVSKKSTIDSSLQEKDYVGIGNSEKHYSNMVKSPPDQYQSKSQPETQKNATSKRKGGDSMKPISGPLPKQMKTLSSPSLTAIAEKFSRATGSGSSSSALASSFGLKTPSNFKMFKDEPIPHGYLKFRFNEDCNFPNCGYRNHQSHFHCIRNDCYYSFCDKTRFVQHTARHERLDKLMGDDFKQYRANMRCGYDECAYNKGLGGPNNKSSHFHCLKCNFICSDTNKVVAHRRQHSKMEYIRMAGFRKVSNNEKCSTSSLTQTTNAESSTNNDSNDTNNECSYYLKQTHYHCLVCDCSVLSRAQLGSHRHRV